jgi:hypothetical protein
MKIWCFLTLQKLVCLQDFDGELTFTPAFKTPYGWMAKRFWPFNIRNVYLKEGGAVEGGVFVTNWRPVE